MPRKDPIEGGRIIEDSLLGRGRDDQAAACQLVAEKFLATESEQPSLCPDPTIPVVNSEELNFIKPVSASELSDDPVVVVADIAASDGGARFIVDSDGSEVVGVLQGQSDAGDEPGVATAELLAGGTFQLVADSRQAVSAVGSLLTAFAKGTSGAGGGGTCQFASTNGVFRVADRYAFLRDEYYPASEASCEELSDFAYDAQSPDRCTFEEARSARLREIVLAAS